MDRPEGEAPAQPDRPTGFDHCHPSSPFRVPDHRWHFAAYLVVNRWRSKYVRRDPWLKRCVAFRRAALRHGSARHPRVARLDPALAAACGLRFDAAPEARDELEARLLTGVGFAAAAGRCGLGPDAVEAYGRAFYDVADRLGATDYVTFAVLGPAGTLAGALKALAYRGGPAALDAALHDVGWRPAPSAEVPPAYVLKGLRAMYVPPEPGVPEDSLPVLCRLLALLDRTQAASAVSGASALSRPIQGHLAGLSARPASSPPVAALPAPPQAWAIPA